MKNNCFTVYVTHICKLVQINGLVILIALSPEAVWADAILKCIVIGFYNYANRILFSVF
jgi:hypothetical protein